MLDGLLTDFLRDIAISISKQHNPHLRKQNTKISTRQINITKYYKIITKKYLTYI